MMMMKERRGWRLSQQRWSFAGKEAQNRSSGVPLGMTGMKHFERKQPKTQQARLQDGQG